MGLGKRLGEFDDRTAIYRTNDPEQRVHWGRLVVTFLAASVTFSVLMAVGRATIGVRRAWCLCRDDPRIPRVLRRLAPSPKRAPDRLAHGVARRMTDCRPAAVYMRVTRRC